MLSRSPSWHWIAKDTCTCTLPPWQAAWLCGTPPPQRHLQEGSPALPLGNPLELGMLEVEELVEKESRKLLSQLQNQVCSYCLLAHVLWHWTQAGQGQPRKPWWDDLAQVYVLSDIMVLCSSDVR